MSADAVYCISLKRLVDRRKKMIDMLSQVNFCPVYIFDAIDGEVSDITDINKEGFNCYDGWKIDTDNHWWNRPVKMGELCATIGHYLIWKHIIKNGYRKALIFEDDVVFEYNELLRGLNIINDFKKDYDVFYLGSSPVKPGIKENSLIEKCDYTYCLHAYIMTTEGADVLVNSNFLENMIPGDEFVPFSFCDHPRKDLRNIYNLKRKLLAYRFMTDIVHQTNLGGSHTSMIQ
jgi:GR25 family glycosyltransferase involved in LPS biosynthesis